MSTRKAFRPAAAPATPARKRAALMVSAAAVALLTIPASAALAQPELPAAAIPSTTGPFVLPSAPTSGPAVSPTPTAPTGPAPSVLPQDPNVVAGRAGFATTGSNLDINQSTDRVVIDWRSFDIGSEAAVNFHQPNSSSIAVNRVSGGGMPSQIWGTLTANGVVVILNPNGVLFSASSRVDVGGLVASTGQMNVDRFMAGDQRLEFTGATSGAIVTAGQINIAGAGLGAFVAPSVRNDGIINARFGRVALAAGETFTLDLAGDRLIELGLGANTPLVENYGSIIADGGRVQLSALAAGVVVDQVINAGGHISVSSAHQDGGTIVLEGDSVTVSGTLDASGATGGGNILALADHLTVTADARLTAAATVAGDGGFIETSGYETVNIADGATVNAAGAGGAAGTWLIDPVNLTVISGAGGGVSGSTVTAGAIEATLASGTNVSLTTNQTGLEAGDLTVAGSVNATALGGASLILTGRHIVATGGSTISINGGSLTMNVNAVGNVANPAGNWIQDALNIVGTVSGGTTVNLGAGTYGGLVSLSRSVTLAGAGMDTTFLTGGIKLNGSFDDITFRDFTVSGNGGGNAIVKGGNFHNNLTIDGVRFDGGSVAGRHGFASGKYGGAISITNSQFLNIRGWSTFDTQTSGVTTPITSVVFSNNLLDNTVGHIAFRQATPTANVLISNNTVRNVGDTIDLSSGIFKVFGAATVDFIGNNISGIGANPNKSTAGVNDGAALIVTNVGTLNLTDNVFTDNQQALLVGSGNALPAVMNITGNTFDNNAYDIFLPASTGGTVTFGAGNAFISGAATQQHIVRIASGNMDLTGVTFDGQLGSDMSTAELLALEDMITHGTDVAGAGLALVNAGNVYVTQSSGSIQRGVNAADAGFTVNVGDGTYNETVSIARSLTLAGAGMDQTAITGGMILTGAINDLNLSGFTVTGSGASNTVIRGVSASVNNLNLDGVRVDAESVAGRQGISGGHYGGDISITNSEFLNVNHWVVFDTRSGSGAPGSGTNISSFTFSDNLVDNVKGGITVRQNDGGTGSVTISGNTVQNIGDSSESSGGLFKIFNAGTVDFTGNTISDIGTNASMTSNGVAYGAALLMRGVNTLNVADNSFTNVHMAVATEKNGFSAPTLTTFTGNTFTNTGYAFFMPSDALTGGNIVFGAGNAINSGADTVQHIVWRGAAGLDLTNVLFDGRLGSAMSNAELFALEDRITHGTDVAGAGLALVKADNVYVTTASGSIQRGINVASTGYTVNLDGGTFTLPSTLNVNKAIALVGAGRNATVINAAATGYGISVSAGGVELADFTLNGPSADAGSSYGIKVSPGGPRTSVLDGFTINNVTVRGSGRAELDLNGVRNAVIDGFIADGQGTKGAGIQITDSDGVVIRNSSTFDNAWGGVALYLANRSYDQQLANITIEASNDFQEVNSLFFQGESTLYDAPGTLTIEGYSHIVQNDTYRASEGDWIYFQKTLQDALDFAVNLSALDIDSSVVGGWSGTDFDGTFTVGTGNLISGGTQALSIGAAAKAAEAGNTVRVLAGVYNGFATAFGGAANVSILGDAGAIIDGTGVTGRIVDLRADGTIFSGFTIAGDGTGVGVSVSGRDVTVSGNTITDVLTGVQTTTQYAAGNAVISGNTISADYGVSLQNTGNVVSGNTVNAAIEGVGLAQGSNSFSGNTFTIGTGGDALKLYLTASAADMTGGNNTVTIAGGGLQGAVDLALDDGTVNVGDGTYAEDVLVSGVRTLQFGEVTVDGLTLAAGAAGSGVSGDVTSTGDLAFVGDVTLLGNLSLTAAGSTDLAGVTGAGHSLSLTGASVSLGSADDLDALDITGATTLNGGVYAANNVSVTGATTLTRDTTIVGSTITLGSVSGAHSLGLAGTGAVVLGAADLASLTASGATIATAGVTTTGAQSYTGATTLNGAYTGTGFIVTGATTLGGDTTVDGSTITLGSINGAHSLGLAGTGAVVLGAADLASLTASGATIATAGVTTTGAQSYTGATTLNGAYTGTGFTVAGATTLGGDTTVDGTAVTLGTVDGAQALTINGGTGIVRVGALGSTTALASADLSGGTLDINGARTTGAQTYTGAAIIASGQYTTAGGAYTLAGSTTLDGATAVSTQGGTVTTGDVNGTVAGAQSLSVDAGTGSAALGALGSNVRLGAVLIRANTTVLNGATYAGNSLAFEGIGTNANVRLTRALTTFNSTSGSTAGNISVGPNLIGTAAGAQSVAFVAGSGTGADSANGDVTLGNLGSDALRLGAMSVTGSDLTAQTVKLAGDYSSVLSGNQTFSTQTLDTRGNANIRVAGNDAGPIIAGGSVTIVSGGSTTGSLTAGGPVNVTSTGNSNRVITSGGATTVVSQGTIGGSVVSSGPVILTATGPIVSSVTTPGAVSITSDGTVTVNVQASSLSLTAPGGTISGTFGTISTGAGGTFNVNGEVVVGDGTAADRQILVDSFLAPAGGVVGSTGQIQLPVNFALALIAPAGDGSGTVRRPILVNSIERLGELLRLGYTAIIVQIDGGEEYEQELNLAAEDAPQPQV